MKMALAELFGSPVIRIVFNLGLLFLFVIGTLVALYSAFTKDAPMWMLIIGLVAIVVASILLTCLKSLKGE